MIRLMVVPALMGLIFASLASAADKDKFVGAWRLISIEDPSPTASKPDQNPTGYIMYDATGHMSVQIMRRQDRPEVCFRQAGAGDAGRDKSRICGVRGLLWNL